MYVVTYYNMLQYVCLHDQDYSVSVPLCPIPYKANTYVHVHVLSLVPRLLPSLCHIYILCSSKTLGKSLGTRLDVLM